MLGKQLLWAHDAHMALTPTPPFCAYRWSLPTDDAAGIIARAEMITLHFSGFLLLLPNYWSISLASPHLQKCKPLVCSAGANSAEPLNYLWRFVLGCFLLEREMFEAGACGISWTIAKSAGKRHRNENAWLKWGAWSSLWALQRHMTTKLTTFISEAFVCSYRDKNFGNKYKVPEFSSTRSIIELSVQRGGGVFWRGQHSFLWKSSWQDPENLASPRRFPEGALDLRRKCAPLIFAPKLRKQCKN